MVTKIDNVQNYYHVEGSMTLNQTYVAGDQYVGAADRPETADRPEATDMEVAVGSGEVPECLLTEEAARLWQRLREAGFIAASGYGLADGVSNNQAAYIADRMAARLGISGKWKLFGQLWGIRNLAQQAGKWRDTGKLPPRFDEIDRALK